MLKRKAGSFVSALIAALLSAVLFVLLMLVMRVYPFGNHSLLFGDGDRYVSLFASLPDVVLHPDGIFYSWSAAMGSDMTELSAAYLFSPLNLISLLFRRDPLLGFHIAAGLRTCLASAAFCLWLSRKEGLHVWSRTLMGVMYGFSGFTIACLANTSMTDGAVLLPLICIGVNRMLEGGGILIYTVVLAVAVLTGYRMISVFFLASVLFWLRGVFEEKGSWVRIKRTIFPWAAATMLALGISACVLLPIWLTAHPNASFSIPALQVLSGDPRLILSGLFTANMTAADVPPVFAGVMTLVLSLLYFFNKGISPRRKLTAFAALALTAVTFIVPIPYVFRNNVIMSALDTRCSILLIFLLIDMAAESRGRMEDMTTAGYVLGLIAGIAAFVCVILFNKADTGIVPAVIDGVLIAATAGLAWLIGTGRYKRAGLILSLLALTNMLENSWFILHDNVKDSPASSFYDLYDKTKGVIPLLEDTDMYRTASLYSWGRNDSLLHGYASADGYLPGQKAEGPAYADTMGIRLHEDGSVYAYNGASLPEAADSVLSIRYLLSREEEAVKSYKKFVSYSGIEVYENPYALPLLTAVQDLPREAGENAFEIQSLLLKSASGIEEDVYEEVPFSISKKGGDTVLTLAADGKDLFLLAPAMHADVIVKSGSDTSETVLTGEGMIISLGAPDKRKTVTVTLSGEDVQTDGLKIYAEDLTVLKKASAAAQKNAVKLAKLSPAHLKGTCEIPRGSGYLQTTIPYDTGWNITLDGRTAVAGADLNGMLSMAVTEGTHTIEMIYRPAGFVTGLLLTAVSLVLFILFLFLHHGRLRQYRKEDKEKAELEAAQQNVTPDEGGTEELPQGEDVPAEEDTGMTEETPAEETDTAEEGPEVSEEEPEAVQNTGFFAKLFGNKETKPEAQEVPVPEEVPEESPEVPEMPVNEVPEAAEDMPEEIVPEEPGEVEPVTEEEPETAVPQEPEAAAAEEVPEEEPAVPEETPVKENTGFFAKLFGKKEENNEE